MSNPSPLAIRSAILAALTGQIGTYTFSNGVNQSAFEATDTDSALPETPTVSGLEVIYEVEPLGPNYTRLLSLQYSLRRQGRITLKQWDITATTRSALDALIPALTRIPVRIEGNPARVPRSAELGNIETATIQFSYPST
jgi:hypothetical protein